MFRSKLAVLATCLLSFPATAQGRDRRDADADPKLEHGTFTVHDFDSEALDDDADYGVYLPNGYHDEANRDRVYPLVIWLHGMFEDHRRFHARGGSTVLDQMVGSGEVPEMVFVTANGGRSFYINTDNARYEDLVTQDLVRHVEANYRVAGRERRALMGVSMGGYGALKMALKNPELFGTVTAHSAALLPRDPATLEEFFPWLKRWGGAKRLLAGLFGDPPDPKRWAAENLLIMSEQVDADSLADLRIYLDCGDKDHYGFAAPNLELHGILTERGIRHTWRLVEDGDHGWRSGYNQQALPHSLRFVAESWDDAKGGSTSRPTDAADKGNSSGR